MSPRVVARRPGREIRRAYSASLFGVLAVAVGYAAGVTRHTKKERLVVDFKDDHESRTDARRPTGQYLEQFSKHSVARRRQFRGRVIATFFVSSVTFFGIEVSIDLFRNSERLNQKAKSLRLYFAPISEADATVVVLGLFTVVAALNIALASWRDSPSDLAAEDFAAGSHWAEQVEFAATLAATTGFTTALIRAPLTNVASAALTILLLSIGSVSILLSAAVIRWKSHRPTLQFVQRGEIEAFTQRIKAWHLETAGSLWPKRKIFLRAWAFVATFSVLGGAVSVGVARVGGIQTRFWPAMGWFAGISSVIFIFLPGLVVFTIRTWIFERRDSEGSFTRAVRWAYVFIVAALLALPFASVKGLPAAFWFPLGAVELLCLFLPLALLHVARTRRGRFARFANHLRLLWAGQELRSMQDALGRSQ